MTQNFTLTKTISATPRAVYRAFTTNGGQMNWFANAADLDPRVGGRFYLWTEYGYQAMGKFTELEEDRLVAFEIFNPDPTRVELTLAGEENGTVLTLKQENFKDETTRDSAREAWNNTLSNLVSVLETGIDRRLYDRPMLGILIGGRIEEDNYKRYKLPVKYGILISGTVRGMGAEAVGLVADDVLVEMDGIQLENYYDLQQAVEPHKAGESVEIVWYRDGERNEASMTLSGRPIPEVPPTPAELAEDLRSLYARQDAELAELLEDVTELEAEYRPEENEWNVKEIIAHLIQNERAVQIWIANTAEGRVFHSWSASDQGLVKSVVDIHPTLSELTAELQQAEAQTVALVRRLPAEVVDFKGAYHDIATSLGIHGMALHTQQHYKTIRELLESAKGL